MNNKWSVLLGLTIIVLFSASILYVSRDVIITDPVDIIQSNWDLEMPKSAKELFYKSSGVSILGDGERYSVYECEEEDYIRNSFQWKDDKSSPVVEGFKEVIYKIRGYGDNKIPKVYIPDLNKDFLYYYKELEDNSKIYIIYIPGVSNIYISENIF